jgi:hypothetical protein
MTIKYRSSDGKTHTVENVSKIEQLTKKFMCYELNGISNTVETTDWEIIRKEEK